VEATSATEITVGSRALSFSEYKAFTDVPWKEKGVEIVIDCTGVFLTTEVLPPPPTDTLQNYQSSYWAD